MLDTPRQAASLFKAAEQDHGSKLVRSVPPRSLLQVPLQVPNPSSLSDKPGSVDLNKPFLPPTSF